MSHDDFFAKTVKALRQALADALCAAELCDAGLLLRAYLRTKPEELVLTNKWRGVAPMGGGTIDPGVPIEPGIAVSIASGGSTGAGEGFRRC